uniref:Putative secreted protein n=1 Tax=Ixodes ricinus TaxID=34613 RepID=A0A6B0V6Y5_IXORI
MAGDAVLGRELLIAHLARVHILALVAAQDVPLEPVGRPVPPQAEHAGNGPQRIVPRPATQFVTVVLGLPKAVLHVCNDHLVLTVLGPPQKVVLRPVLALKVAEAVLPLDKARVAQVTPVRGLDDLPNVLLNLVRRRENSLAARAVQPVGALVHVLVPVVRAPLAGIVHGVERVLLVVLVFATLTVVVVDGWHAGALVGAVPRPVLEIVVLAQVPACRESTAGADVALEGPLRHAAREQVPVSTVLAHVVPLTVGLGCEPDGAALTLEGLLACVSQDVAAEGARPGKLA